MSDTQPESPASGSVPHTFRLRMARQWVPRMPTQLRRQKAFLFALATVAAMADAAGRTRWHATPDEPGRPLPLRELAAAMGSDEKDARRYLAAAIAAGLLTTEQAPRRGRTTVYVLLVPPVTPRWAAALAVLTVGEEEVEETGPHTTAGRTENGGRFPDLDSGAARASSGDGSPLEFGGRFPHENGGLSPEYNQVLHDQPQEMVAVGPQLRDARGQETHERAHDPSPPTRTPPLHSVPPPQSGPRPGGRPTGADRQLPLLMPVPGPVCPSEQPARTPAHSDAQRAPQAPQMPAQPDPVGYGAPPEGWRARVASERPDDAARVYRDRWTGERAAYLPHPTGT